MLEGGFAADPYRDPSSGLGLWLGFRLRLAAHRLFPVGTEGYRFVSLKSSMLGHLGVSQPIRYVVKDKASVADCH